MLKSREFIIKIWLEHISKNYKGILSIYFDYLVGFSQYIANRPQLVTITDRDIWITDKIFREIRAAQRKILV
jgi:hypothetical protein